MYDTSRKSLFCIKFGSVVPCPEGAPQESPGQRPGDGAEPSAPPPSPARATDVRASQDCLALSVFHAAPAAVHLKGTGERPASSPEITQFLRTTGHTIRLPWEG